MLHLLGRFIFFLIRTIIHLPFAILHQLHRAFFGVNFDKMDGYEFEEYAASYLRHKHYKNVTVTKASRDFGVDITAKKHHTTYAIQCKLYQGKVGNSAIQEAVAGKTYYGCDEAMVITNSYFYPGAQELARVNDVILLDGDALKVNPIKLRRSLKCLQFLLMSISCILLIPIYFKEFIVPTIALLIGLLTIIMLIMLHTHRHRHLSDSSSSAPSPSAELENLYSDSIQENTKAPSSRLSPEELEAFMYECAQTPEDD